MALPREHHNGLTTHFLITLILDWTTWSVSNTTKFRCHRLKTSQHLCYFGNNNKQRGSSVILKSQIIDIFATDNFRMMCDENGLIDTVTFLWWPSWFHFNLSVTVIFRWCLLRTHQHCWGRWGVQDCRRTCRAFPHINNQQ